MEHEQEAKPVKADRAKERKGRSWTERFTGPIRYHRFTDYNGGGVPSILFKFELAPGQTDLPQEVYDVLKSLKRMNPSPGHGRDHRPHSGLEFTRDTRHGRVWRLPATETGRTAADIIDAKLIDLAEKLEQVSEKGR